MKPPLGILTRTAYLVKTSSLKESCFLFGFILFLNLFLFFPTQIDAKKEQLADARRDLKSAKADAKVLKDAKTKKYVPGVMQSWELDERKSVTASTRGPSFPRVSE